MKKEVSRRQRQIAAGKLQTTRQAAWSKKLNQFYLENPVQAG